MGGCQKYGPLLRPLNIKCRIILRTQKGTIILTTIYTYLQYRQRKAPGRRGASHGRPRRCRRRLPGSRQLLWLGGGSQPLAPGSWGVPLGSPQQSTGDPISSFPNAYIHMVPGNKIHHGSYLEAHKLCVIGIWVWHYERQPGYICAARSVRHMHIRICICRCIYIYTRIHLNIHTQKQVKDR